MPICRFRRVLPVPTLLAIAGVLAAADAPVPKPVDATVVVTATKQVTDQLTVPATINVADREEIGSVGARGLGDLWPRMPLVTQSDPAHLSIRGIGYGETPRTGGEENPTRGMLSPVGLYLDGAPVEAARGLAAFDDLLDVERVEVLKGPQGTLYGRNALGGVINVTSRDPGLRGEIDGHAFYGSDNELRLSAAGGGPVVGGLGARVAAGYSQSDGTLKNNVSGDDQTAEWRRWQGRGKLLWRAADDLDMRLTLGGTRYEGSTDTWVPYANRESRETQTGNPGDQRIDGATAALQVDWHASADDTLTGVYGITTAKDEVSYDADRSPADAVGVEGWNRATTGSAELRWNHHGKDPVSWLVGLFAESERVDYNTTTRFSAADPGLGFPYYQIVGFPETLHKESRADSRSIALFGEGTWDIDQHWALTAGLRLGYEHTQFTWGQVTTNTMTGSVFLGGINIGTLAAEHAADESSAVVLPKLALSYHIDELRTVYASAVRGYRAGGFNTNASSASSAQVEYDPEYTWNYEAGLRSLWLERKLGVNLTGFYTDWRDQQVFTNATQPYDVLITNASRSHVLGAELEVAWREREGLSLWADTGFMQAEYDDRQGSVTKSGVVTAVNYDGKRFALIPQWTWAVGAGYRHASGAFARADWHGQSWSYVDDENTERADPVALLDARIGWAGTWLSVALVGRNLTDETYITNSFFQQGDSVLTTDTTYVRLGASRSVGVEVSAWW